MPLAWSLALYDLRFRIAHLEAADVTQVCLYLGIVEPEFHFSTLETYGREIIPHFRTPGGHPA